MTQPSPHDLLRRLATGPKLPAAARRALLDDGPAIVPGLLALLGDKALALTTAPGGGYVPIHAAELLAELRPAEAVELILRALCGGDRESILHETLLGCLPAWGAAVLEPGLRALAEAATDDERQGLLGVLAQLGVRDERIFAMLVNELDEHVVFAANYLADYGDERAVGHLERAAASIDPIGDEDVLGVGQDLIEIRAAIQHLGAEPSASLRAKVAKVARARQSSVGALATPLGLTGAAAPPKAKVGRNDPCPCGSGKKYKKCCWLEDQAAKQ